MYFYPLINFANDKKNFNKILITPHAGGSTIDAHNLVLGHVARELNKKLIYEKENIVIY